MAHIFGSFISEHSNANIISQFRRAIFTSSANVQMCNYVPCHRLTNSNIFLPKSPLNIQKRSFGGYLEEYYTTSNASTGFSTPLRSLFIYSLVVLQTALVFGTLFHTNYYFTGRILPKADGNTQLCSDSIIS